MSSGFKIIEHTADVGIKVWAHTLKELFEESAIGMVSQMYDLTKVNALGSSPLSLQGETLEELFLLWLKEILFIIENEMRIFSAFQIEKENFSARNPKSLNIQALLKGEKLDFSRHDICKEIKGITRHGFYIKRNGPWWETNILFDI